MTIFDFTFCRKTKHDDDIGVKARAKTHAVVRPTHVPSWEEMISVEVDEPKSENEGKPGIHIKTSLELKVDMNDINRYDMHMYMCA